jgi:hypothetical protein
MICPACTEKRVHTAEDWKHHPYAGHGYQERLGWTHPDLESRGMASNDLEKQEVLKAG